MRWITRALVAAFFSTIAPGHAEAETNLVVRSHGDCPSGQAVAEAAWAVRPDSEWPAMAVTLDVVEDRVQVTLGDDPKQRRELPVPVDCADRARLVAVVLAAWTGELPTHATAAPVLSVEVPAPAPLSADVPSPAPRAGEVSAPAPLPTKQSAMLIELGLSGFYSALGDLVPGTSVELGLLRREGWWGIRGSAGLQSTSSRRVSMGESQYDRTLLTAAMVLQRNRPRSFHSLDLGLIGAHTRAHGIGYSQNESASGLNVGPAVDGRAGVRLGAFRVWGGVRVYRWLLQESIRVDPVSSGVSSTATLPAWNAQLGLGAGVVFD